MHFRFSINKPPCARPCENYLTAVGLQARYLSVSDMAIARGFVHENVRSTGSFVLLSTLHSLAERINQEGRILGMLASGHE